MNWLHALFLTISLLNRTVLAYFIIDIILALLLNTFEVLSLMCSGHKEYFSSSENLIDCYVNIATIPLLVYTYTGGESDESFLQYIKVFTLTLVYYRSFMFLTIFKIFSHTIKMIREVAKSTFSFLIIVFLIILCIAFLLKIA